MLRYFMSKIIFSSLTGIGDPFILPFEGLYFHYSTSSPEGFLVWTSSDLLHWENRGLCYRDSKVGTADFWAPEVYFRQGRFYLFFTSKNPEKNRLMLSVAVSDSPYGPFQDPLDHPVFDFGYAAIDGSVFTDEDGRSFLLFARDCSENIVNGVHTSQIYGAELTADLLHVKNDPILLTSPEGSAEQADSTWQWNEGPFLLKDKGTYFLSYSVNYFADKRYSVCYATASTPLGPFRKAEENPILNYRDGEFSGPGHNMYFRTFEGETLTAFHVHTDPNHPSGDRRTCFAPYHFEQSRLVIDAE